ncbi:MAG: hypothetical protein U0Y68_07195 [Blastocatellia bacterium]
MTLIFTAAQLSSVISLAYVYGPAAGDQTGKERKQVLTPRVTWASRYNPRIFCAMLPKISDAVGCICRWTVACRRSANAHASDPQQQAAFQGVLHRLTQIAESYYAAAAANLDAFAPDCRTAIHACIDVYRH